MKSSVRIITAILAILLLFCSCTYIDPEYANENQQTQTTQEKTTEETREASEPETNPSEETTDPDDIPEFDNKPYIPLNNNLPDFEASELTTTSYETYGKLDYLGRCTRCISCIGQDIMPTQNRGAIGEVKPTGWHSDKYDNVDGHYLYNRCHLIGYQLTAENANERNLITGTRYLNVQGMLPFEDEVADYVKSTGNHVLYEVTPIFKDAELLARGVHMQAMSVEDNGHGVSFNVYCYNAQPGIEIDYKTGDNRASKKEYTFDDKNEKNTYIININSKKFHLPSCEAVDKMSENNKKKYKGTKENLIKNGYSPCKICNP
ncbi:MAG: DNA/RNA non-specific endonuclease [Eubacterium sp.]|nr:DNA/RNA non-specific endonuclease [Eubacterium sp.]